MTNSGGNRYSATGSAGGACAAKTWLGHRHRRERATLNFIRATIMANRRCFGETIFHQAGNRLKSRPTELVVELRCHWLPSVSVSVEIVASCDDFSERGCVRSTSRSASKPPEIPVSLQPFVPFLPAAAGPADTAALLWMRLCRLCRVAKYAS